MSAADVGADGVKGPSHLHGDTEGNGGATDGQEKRRPGCAGQAQQAADPGQRRDGSAANQPGDTAGVRHSSDRTDRAGDSGDATRMVAPVLPGSEVSGHPSRVAGGGPPT